jgi:hypothetical protein
VTVPELAVLAGAIASAVMTGVIWFVQIVHYPMLATVPAESVSAVSRDHRWRTTVVVGPPMAVEGITTLVLLLRRPDGVDLLGPWIAAGLLGVALGVTMWVSVPLHMAMSDRGDAGAARRLVVTNWWRTAAWSGRAVVMAVMVAQMT